MTPEQKAFYVLQFAKRGSVVTMQQSFSTDLKVTPFGNSIQWWHEQFQTTGYLCKGKSTGYPCVSERCSCATHRNPFGVPVSNYECYMWHTAQFCERDWKYGHICNCNRPCSQQTMCHGLTFAQKWTKKMVENNSSVVMCSVTNQHLTLAARWTDIMSISGEDGESTCNSGFFCTIYKQQAYRTFW